MRLLNKSNMINGNAQKRNSVSSNSNYYKNQDYSDAMFDHQDLMQVARITYIKCKMLIATA